MSKADKIYLFKSQKLNRDLNLLSSFYFDVVQHKKCKKQIVTEMAEFVKKYHILETVE